MSHASPSPPSQRRFGPFSFDEASGELCKYGIRMRLQGQPLQLLAAVLRQPGHIVTREEFQQQLWRGSTFVDFEHGLNSAMNRLRQVLGDSADQPRYIETVPGRGYRFIAPVEEQGTGPVLVISPPVAEPARARRGLTGRQVRLSWILAGGAMAFLAGAYLIAIRPHGVVGGTPLRFSISPPEGYALEAGSSRQTFAVSPDGTRVAYTAMDVSGRFHAFVRDLNALESRPVANTVGAYHQFWAPDGRSLFLSVNGKLWRTFLESDSHQVVCDIPVIMLNGVLVGPTLWISTRFMNFTVPASGGTPKEMNGLYPWPSFLPDGKHVLYTVFDPRLGRHHARVVKLGEPKTAIDLLETDSRTMYAPSVLHPGTGYLLYVRAGNIVAQPFDPRSLRMFGDAFTLVAQTYSFLPTGAADFSVSENGVLAYRRYLSRSQLAWVNREGQVVSTVGPANVNLKQGRISPDGKKIATPIFDVTRGVNDMWIIDTETGAARVAIVGQGLVDNPAWAPDSHTLAFNRAYDRGPKLFSRGIGENDVEQSAADGFFQVASDWSRDGRFIAFTNTSLTGSENTQQGDVWLIDMAHGRKVIHLIDTPFHEGAPAFSPDSRWLAFTSNESGRSEVYVQALEASETPRLVGERVLVSRHGAISLRWRRDGRELFYLAYDGHVHAVPITLSAKPKVGESAPLFMIGTEARAAIHSMQGFDVSPDGQRFLIPTITSHERSEIVVMQNWEAALPRGAGKPD